MKLTFVNHLYHPCAMGGAQRSVRTLCEAFIAEGHDVSVIAISEQGRDEHYELNGVKVNKIPIANVYNPYAKGTFTSNPAYLRWVWHARDVYNLKMQQRVAEVDDFRNADVVYFHCVAGYSTAVWGAPSPMDPARIAVLHDYYALCGRSAMYNAKERRPCGSPCPLCSALRLPARRYSQEIDAVIGVSEFTLNKHLDNGLFPQAKTFVIHNAYNRRSPLEMVPSQRPRQFGYLGSLISEKGIDVMLDAFCEFNSKSQGSALHIFGDGPAEYVNMLKARTQGRPVHWHGTCATEAALAQIDVLVVPSMWDEPFGRVVIEALSAALPVIGARRGGITEILASRDYSMLFEPSNLRELVDGFLHYANLPDDVFEAGRRAAVTRGAEFGEAQHFTAHKEVLGEAISARRARTKA